MDLNLLRVFVAVYELGSLTAAAERLFVSQSAVSQSVSRMRRDLDDPLFHRDGRTMRPSRVAETLYPEFRAALDRIDGAVDGVRGFDAASSERRFRVALSELGEIGFLPGILAAVDAVAPKVAVDVVPLDIDALPEWLARGAVDLAITSSPVGVDFEAVTVKSERFVALMADSHPLAGRDLTLRAYSEAAHISVSGDSARPNVEAALRRVGVAVTPSLTVSHFSGLPGLLVGGQRITTVPASLAASWIRIWPLKARALPYEIEPVQVRLFARSAAQQSSALRWFHGTVLDGIHAAPEMFWPQ